MAETKHRQTSPKQADSELNEKLSTISTVSQLTLGFTDEGLEDREDSGCLTEWPVSTPRRAPQALEGLSFDGVIGKNGLKASGRSKRALGRTISQHSFRCEVFVFFFFFVVVLSDRTRPLSAKFFF